MAYINIKKSKMKGQKLEVNIILRKLNNPPVEPRVLGN